MTKIEEVYKELCSERNSDIYFQTYAVVKSRLATSYFDYIRDVQPFMTDHGIGHIDRILEKLYRFLEPHLPVSGNPNDRIIDVENLSLLMHAVLWHDVGNLYGRIEHEKNIVKIFDTVKTFLYDPFHQEWIVKIGEAHCGEGSIEQKIEDASRTIHDSVIYPQFLSSLLRISDEIDEDQRRVQSRAFSLVPKQSQAFWKFCSFNESIIPVYQRDSLGNVALEIEVNSKIRRDELYQKLGKNAEEVIAIEEYIARLDKINRQRIYCNGFLQQRSAIYFHGIDRIRVAIVICDEHDATLDKIFFIFGDDSSGTDFFNDESIIQILNKYKHLSGGSDDYKESI